MYELGCACINNACGWYMCNFCYVTTNIILRKLLNYIGLWNVHEILIAWDRHYADFLLYLQHNEVV